jgi:hypothetical protein
MIGPTVKKTFVQEIFYKVWRQSTLILKSVTVNI